MLHRVTEQSAPGLQLRGYDLPGHVGQLRSARYSVSWSSILTTNLQAQIRRSLITGDSMPTAPLSRRDVRDVLSGVAVMAALTVSPVDAKTPEAGEARNLEKSRASVWAAMPSSTAAQDLDVVNFGCDSTVGIDGDVEGDQGEPIRGRALLVELERLRERRHAGGPCRHIQLD
jgi:hypothetical protein